MDQTASLQLQVSVSTSAMDNERVSGRTLLFNVMITQEIFVLVKSNEHKFYCTIFHSDFIVLY